MKIVVTGAGRGGTNLGIELIRSFNSFNVTERVEDRSFFDRKSFPNLYATKLATENKKFSIQNIESVLNKNKDLVILFMTRHPIDNCLSKILRGRPKSKGGDSALDQVATDGTFDGAVKSLKHMSSIYKYLIQNYKDRVFVLKMEDLILETKDSVNKFAKFANLKVNKNVFNFYKNNRNKYQKRRYGDSLAANVNLYKNLNKNFEGYFSNKEIVAKLRKSLRKEISLLGYEDG